MLEDTVSEFDPVYVEQAGPKTILIVDDDADQAETLSRRLLSQGYETLTADTAKQALELARAERPHLVLLDLGLPDADGFDVCRELDDGPQTTSIPVIIVSGEERPDVLRRARGAGSQFYVRKPYDPNALLILIESALQSAESW